MRYQHVLIKLVLILLPLGLAGCSSAPERELSNIVPRYVMLPNGKTPLSQGQRSIVQNDLGKAVKQKLVDERRKINILQLSGGGQNGAFGAGFLKGWAETGQRPQFDIVTGVSTGAILSTFAFLGTPEDDDVLQDTWLSLNSDSIYKKRVLSRLVTGKDSLYDSTALAELLEQVITPSVLERVAKEYDKGRRLYVSTTNLDYDQTWVWDLTALARYGGNDALDIYRRAVRASASPPVIFEPVMINGSLFVDGGTKHNLLIVGLTGSADNIFEGTGIEIGMDMILGHTYTIMHHQALDEGHAVRADVKDIITRASNIMISTSNADTLLRSYFVTRLQHLDYNVAYVPQDLDISEDVLAFDPDEMRSMYEAGRQLAKSPEPWRKKPYTTGEVAPWLMEEVSRRLEADID